MTEPLTDLLQKDQTYTWDGKCIETFKKIKGFLVSAPLLVTPRFDNPFILMVDASYIGAGAALVQKDHKGLEHFIAYFSRKFNKSQKKSHCLLLTEVQ